MPHSWKAYEVARLIADRLLDAEFIQQKDWLTIRGIIQIILEEQEETEERV